MPSQSEIGNVVVLSFLQARWRSRSCCVARSATADRSPRGCPSRAAPSCCTRGRCASRHTLVAAPMARGGGLRGHGGGDLQSFNPRRSSCFCSASSAAPPSPPRAPHAAHDLLPLAQLAPAPLGERGAHAAARRARAAGRRRARADGRGERRRRDGCGDGRARLGAARRARARGLNVEWGPKERPRIEGFGSSSSREPATTTATASGDIDIEASWRCPC